MIPVKIECGCGQHYAFDVEPVNGRMASTVACPVCGLDGTEAANTIIAQTLAAQTAEAPPPTNGGGLHLATAPRQTASPVHRGGPSATVLGLVDHDQAVIQARAKVSWGDSKEEVINYLMLQGFSYPEASELIGEMFKVRASETRKIGVRKIIVGSGFVCVPIIYLPVFVATHFIFWRILIIAIAIGVWGLWKILNGIIMIVAPKMEKGDLGAQ